MNSSKEKLSHLRDLMAAQKIDAYIVPFTDPHLGEYIPDHWRIIEWFTGFTGSAANVVVTDSFAGLWTDSRYFIQAADQLSSSGFELMKLKIPHADEHVEWLKKNIKEGGKIAVDGSIISIGLAKTMEKEFERKKIILSTNCDLIADIWTDRPPMPVSVAFDHPVQFAGKERSAKLAEVREHMKIINVQYHLLTSVDDIMWLLNIRGNDVKYSPLLTCFALLGLEQMLLFINEEKIPLKLCSEFDMLNIVMLPYEEISYVIETLPSDSSLLITPATTSSTLYKSIPAGMNIIEDVSIPTRLKAIKNKTEIENIKNVMIKDGTSLTKFFYWLDRSIGKIIITEISAAGKLLELKMQQEHFLTLSFSTIAGYNEHGSLPHYSSTEGTNVELKKSGILLVDSGGQYIDGTTDITRTIALGEPTPRQKRDFTLALKGTINLAMAKFPAGTRGYQIDVLARKALWDNGLNYGHGTGHGVGYCLNVHEGPQNIGTSATGDLKTILEPGMLISDEPAIYRDGEYGFRTENLILCIEDEKTDYGQFLKFETVSLCYIDNSLIDLSLLTDKETDWLNTYHKTVFEKLAPYLPEEEKKWLKLKTKPYSTTISSINI
jgi:Xaa-Pro aminopeptidase